MSLRKVIPVSPSEFSKLISRLQQQLPPLSRIIPIDATWYMPNLPHNGRDQFLKESRLKTAAFFDLDEIALPKSEYPHMLPSRDDFSNSIRKMGIGKNDRLVVYDKIGIFSSPRAAWSFSLYGNNEVYLLNNFTKYKEEGYPLDQGEVQDISTTHPDKPSLSFVPATKTEFDDRYRSQVIEFEELLELLETGRLEKEYVVFDARAADRFSGKTPEPRPGLSSGHIPLAFSLPFPKVLEESDGTFKSREELVELFFTNFGIDFTKSDPIGSKKIIVMCGTGVTAVILRLALELVIQTSIPIRVYDGSWTEWAQRAPSKYIVKSE